MKSLVLGWLTHVGFTGGQLLLVPLDLTSGETVVWNSAFSFVVIGVVVLLVIRYRSSLLGRDTR